MKGIKNIFSFFMRIVKCVILRIARLFIKRKKNFIAIGSWCGERYMDNSRYLMEYLDTSFPDFTLFWVGNKEIREEVLDNTKNVHFLEKGRLLTDFKLLKCKYFFFSQFHNGDISSCNVFGNAVLCYLHHGMPIKKWAADGLNQLEKPVSGLKKKIWHFFELDIPYDYFVTSSSLHDKSNCTSLGYKGCNMDKNLPSGTPRNDMLVNFNSSFAQAQKEKYAKQFNFNPESKVIMYLPTYRRVSDNIFSFSKINDDQRETLDSILEKHNAVLIEKSHVAEKVEICGVDSKRIKFADKNVNVQEMILFTDFMISDYSGAYLDFILLDRPVIHFVYDYDFYKNVDSGLYYEIEDFSAGAVVEKYDDMLLEIDRLLLGNDDYKAKRAQVVEKFMTYEKGNASEIIVNKVILNDVN